MKYTYLILISLILASCGGNGYQSRLQSRAETQQPLEVRLVDPVQVTFRTDTQFVFRTCDTVFIEVPVYTNTTPYNSDGDTATAPANPNKARTGDYRDHLGVVITPASDKLITGVPDDVSRAFKHVRYMGNGYSLRGWDAPSTGVVPNECASNDLSKIWNECEKPGMQSSMVRLNNLCTQFPDATITFVNEYFVGFNWPWKTLTKQELLGDGVRGRINDFVTTGTRINSKPDSLGELFLIEQLFNKYDVGEAPVATPRSIRQMRNLIKFRDLNQSDKDRIYEIYYQEYSTVLNSLSVLPNQIILEVMNENWGRAYIEVANIQYQAAMDAHIAHTNNGGSVILSSGPRQWTNRTINWAGGLLAESILEVPTFFLQYLDKTGGVVSMNLYPDDPEEKTESGFVLYENWEGSPEWYEVDKLSDYLEVTYPNITFNISETGYTSSPKEEMPTQFQRLMDREYLVKLIDKCLDNNVDIIYMYQIAEHSAPEGKFTGTAVLEDIDWWISLSNSNMNE